MTFCTAVSLPVPGVQPVLVPPLVLQPLLLLLGEPPVSTGVVTGLLLEPPGTVVAGAWVTGAVTGEGPAPFALEGVPEGA
ncbi:MAG TPA: hypothetical protein VGF26_12915 [Ramlibacter sp.]